MRFRKSRAPRAREPRFWDRSLVSTTSQVLQGARTAQATQIGVPSLFASNPTVEQDYTVLVIKLGLDFWVQSVGGLGQALTVGGICFGVYVDDADAATSRDPYFATAIDAQTDWLYLGHFLCAYSLGLTASQSAFHLNNGNIYDDTFTVKSRRRVEANEALYFTWSYQNRAGVIIDAQGSMAGTVSLLWQRSLRKR